MSVSVGALTRMPFSTSLAVIKLAAEIAIKLVQHRIPLGLAVSDLIQLFFHRGGETVIHQIIEIFHQAVGDQLADFFCVKRLASRRT